MLKVKFLNSNFTVIFKYKTRFVARKENNVFCLVCFIAGENWTEDRWRASPASRRGTWKVPQQPKMTIPAFFWGGGHCLLNYLYVIYMSWW